ncbi:CD276 antigen-like [Micropterus dolomieu]|uniref:CD276 antigen-like n=1 Tax=Micropterus dolomieu TaxID=147949 RepID=UPI001E8E20D7|nr:CD276 antigen-like [Micropterus dolomieu]
MALLYPATIMKLLLVLMSTLSLVDAAALSALICSHQPIVALAGDDVILPCHLEPAVSASSETVEWTKPGLDPEHIHIHQDGRLMYQNPSYNDRTILFMDELTKGNVSLKIFSVKTSDAGKYKCFLPFIQKEASIQLIVGESDVIGSHEPVTVVVGDDVILPCHLETPFDVKTLTVEWKCNKTIAHIYRNKKDDLVDQDQKFKGRTSLFPDEMTKGNISLKLTNVTEQDAGIFTCYVPKLHSQVKKGNITLIVEKKPEPIRRSQTDNDSIVGIVVVGIIVTSIVGAVLLKMRHDKGGQNMGNTGDCEENNPETVILNEEDISDTA